MKKIEAIIRDTKFQEVKNVLTKLGVKGMTTYEVRGRGDQVGMIRSEGDVDYEADDLVPKRKIEIVCIEEELHKIVSSIATHAFTGKPGDGKIFIYDVVDVIRIRSAAEQQNPSE